jgi:hypothetical protein
LKREAGSMAKVDSKLTCGKMATHMGVQSWQLTRLANDGLIPHEMAGSYRIFNLKDEGVIRRALQAAGYLKEDGVNAEPNTEGGDT